MITTNFDSHEIQIEFTHNTYFNQHQSGNRRGEREGIVNLSTNKTGQKHIFFCDLFQQLVPAIQIT